MAKATLKRSRRSQAAAAVRKRSGKRVATRTKKTARARKTAAARATRTRATRPTSPALARERRTLTEEPAVPITMAPEMEASSPESHAAGEDRASEAGATSTIKGEEFE